MNTIQKWIRICCLTLAFHLVFACDGFSQTHSKVWTFGTSAGIDFKPAIPIPTTTGLMLSSESGTTVTDASGNLLFFASGNIIYNRRYRVMKNGNGLIGNGGSSAQAPLVLQNPADSNQYYVFETADETYPEYKGQLHFSIVDLCGDNGFGEVLSNAKNILIPGSYSERITAVPLKGGQAFWILTSKLFENTIYAFYFDKNGIKLAPVTSFFGSQYSAEVGFIIVNHQKNQFLYSSSLDQANNGVWLMNFDTLTGLASNQIQISFDQHSYGIAFSPDDKFAYYSYFYFQSGIVQIEISTNVSFTLVDYSGNYLYGALAEGPDHIIYIAKPFQDNLAAITKPNQNGANCAYVENYFQLVPNTSCYLSLQNSEFIFKTKKYIHSNSNLLGNDTTLCEPFNLNLHVDQPNILWSDGSSSPDLLIQKIGTYWVSYYNCDTIFTDSIHILKTRDTVKLSVQICPDDSVQIQGIWYKDSTQISRTYPNKIGCDSTVITRILIYPRPDSALQIFHICPGDSIRISGSWYTDSIHFKRLYSDIHGCDSIVNIAIEVYPKTIDIKELFGICPGDSLLLRGQWYYHSATLTKNIQNSNSCDSVITTQIIEYPKPVQTNDTLYFCEEDSIKFQNTWYTKPATIVLKLQNNFGCDSIHQTDLVQNPLLQAPGVLLSICRGDSIFIDNRWISDTMSLTIRKSNANQCDSIYHYSISFFNQPFVTLDPELQVEACKQIQLFPKYSGNAIAFHWSPSIGLSCLDCNDPYVNPTGTMKYFLEITDANGCKANDSILIRVRAVNETIYFPNVFSPNGDNINDVWMPVLSNDQGSIVSMSIYDRWGDLIHDCHSSSNCFFWDGTANETKCLQGVYVYVVEWKDCTGVVKLEKGDVTLMR